MIIINGISGAHLGRAQTHQVPGEIKRSRDLEEGGEAGPSS